MTTDLVFQKGIDYIREAHKGQIRKYTGEAYYLHPIRVMANCLSQTDDRALLMAALLYDILEDTPITYGQLSYFVSTVLNEEDTERCMRYVIELTDVFIKKNYPQWNRKYRKKQELDRLKYISAEAQTIKYADIIDNAADISLANDGFAAKLLKEYANILRLLDKGNHALRSGAVAQVASAMTQIRQNC